MKLSAVAALAAVGAAVSGCATIVEGTTQSVSVNTSPVQGSQCTLINSQGTWYLTTPGSAVVHKTKTDMDVTCNHPGYAPGHVLAVAHFGATTVGNVIAGGVVGIGVDAISGANYHYDSPIYVPLGGSTGGTAGVGGDLTSSFPVSVHCTSPSLNAALMSDGPAGYVTATVHLNINSSGDAGTIEVAPSKDGVCTVDALEGISVRSASFGIDPSSSWAASEVFKHIDIVETPPDAGRPGTHYTFTVKAKDAAKGNVTLKFPIAYR